MDEAQQDGNVIPLRADSPGRRRPAPTSPDSRDDAEVYAFTGAANRSDELADVLGELADSAAEDALTSRRDASREQRAAALLAFLRRRVAGNYRVDEFGFDPDLAETVVLPLFRALYERWFRVEVNGMDNVPASGGALLVANHAGGLRALDAAMTAVAVHDEHPQHRVLRMLGADLVFATPGLSVLARRTGATLACRADAERLLCDGELVGVWPEGFKGIGKPFRDRYQLQRFGRGGFVRCALAAGVPIIPVSIVGAEEIHPVLGNAKALARTLNLPYFPLTPTFPWLGPLGLVPLPSKWYIEFGAPIDPRAFLPVSGRDDGRLERVEDIDDGTLFELTDHVRESIQATLYRLLVQRRSVWR